MILEQILLRCFHRIHGERSSSNIYHLINGKRSIQTIQDAHIYKLEKYFGIYKNISKSYFDIKIQELLQSNYLININKEESIYVITNQGLEWINLYPDEQYFFNGLSYLDKAGIFMDRLLLLIQTLTNSKMNFYSFIPVISNQEIEHWVKKIYRNVKGSESKILNQIYSELNQLLMLLPDNQAMMFVDRLSGYKLYGLSLYQLAEKYQLTKDDVHLVLESIIHRMIYILEKDPTNFPKLSMFIDGQSGLSQLTHSAKQTYHYLLKNYTVEQIAKMRRLKENTIYDHLVEIAFYYEDFPIRNYVTEEEEMEILDVIKTTKSHRLKHIKDKLNKNINYFQIRLVIALENKRK